MAYLIENQSLEVRLATWYTHVWKSVRNKLTRSDVYFGGDLEKKKLHKRSRQKSAERSSHGPSTGNN